jgi:putative transposase
MGRRATKQLELPSCHGWGGARTGAGRPRRRGTGPSHVARSDHDARWPVHVTLRAVAALPSFRAKVAFGALSRALARATRSSFRVLQFSVQSDHLHLIVEADSTRALSRGLQGLAGRCARAVNRCWNRQGAVWAHRYHARALSTPTEVRRALSYVLLNFRKHLRAAPGVDPRSSGPWFDGWAHRATPSPHPRLVANPRTWLATVGWRRAGGLLDVRERPSRS